MRATGSVPANRFAVLGDDDTELSSMPAPVPVPVPAMVISLPTIGSGIAGAIAGASAGASAGAGASASTSTGNFASRLRQTGGARPTGPRHAPPKLTSEIEFPTLGGGASRRPPAILPPSTFTGTGSFADKAREAAARDAQEAEERAAAEAHRQAELDREAYERRLLVGRFSGMSFTPRDDIANRSAAYEEEDRLRGMEVAPEETAWRPGTPPYPPITYIPGVDGPAEESKGGGWDTTEQDEAW
jgi:hypothetical protein